MSKKIFAVIMAIAIVLSTFSVTAFANEDVTDTTMQGVYSVLDKVVNGLVGGIAAMIKTPNWQKKSEYKTPDTFLEGNSESDFYRAANDSNEWHIGYNTQTILTGKEVGGGDYFVGGSLAIGKKLATAQWDDQRIRTIAISDGGKINIFAVLDAYGLANTDVRAIRKAFLSQYKGSVEINTINISVLHQHSCVDTFGMNGDLVAALFTSSFKTTFGLELPSGQNKEYMENLYKVTVDSMNKAIADMKTGELYYGTADMSEFIRDKRDPEVYDPNLNRFRFVPDDKSKETWIVEGALHCVGNGAGNTELTGDYPYYMQEYLKDKANFFYIQGAELAISDTDKTRNADGTGGLLNVIKDDWKPETAETRALGETLAKKLEAIDPQSETKVEPVINVRFTECWIEIDNNILVLAAKGGLLVNNVCKSGLGKYEIVTEVGYAELGNEFAIAIIPGELAPEIAFGYTQDDVKYPEALSWNNENWEYESFDKVVGNKKLLVFGLTNDQVGYLLMNNNWHSIFTENEEVVSAGKYAGAQVASTFISLYKTIFSRRPD